MAIRIVYPSAQEYWLEEKGFPPGCKEWLQKEIVGRESIRQTVSKLAFKNPIHLAVLRTQCRAEITNIVFHSLTKKLPQHSFVPISKSVYISSPELCFLQAARCLPIHQLVQLGCNLCAMFVLDPYEDYWQRKRTPITTTENIKDYLEEAKTIKGRNNARIAIKYVLDNSNSPMETNLATIAMLPWKYGGYGWKKPGLNYEVELSESGAEHLGRKTCCCDMVWLEEKVVLEYDSNLAHLTADQHMRDKKRSTALSLSGYTIISVTAQDLKNFRTIEELFLRVRKVLGMRTDLRYVEANFEKRYEVVHDIMFSKN